MKVYEDIKMKKIFKLLICLSCLLMITACGSDDKEAVDNQNKKTEEIKDNDKKEDTKISSKYFKGYEKEYKLNVNYYKIKLPVDYISTNNSLRSDSINMITTDGKKLGALITTTEVYEELNPDFTINNIREEFKTDRSSKLRLIFLNDNPVYNDQPVETTVGNKKALLDKGVATDSGEKYVNMRCITCF